jgi:cytochrome b
MSNVKSTRIRVWDLPTRLFHWLLVGLIVCAWASYEFSHKIGDTGMLWHRLNGYAIIVLVLWRLLWGVAGSPASRFVNFVVWPWTAARYGIDLIHGRDRHFLGHNPLGSYMIIALLVGVAVQGMLGLFSTEHNSVTWGPLSHLVSESASEWYTKTHDWFFENVLLFLIGAHIVANVFYRLVKKDPLIEAMVTGSKPAGDYEDAKMAGAGQNEPADPGFATGDVAPARGTMARALLCLAIAIAIFVAVIKGLGGKLYY